jgi:hypothetical protein
MNSNIEDLLLDESFQGWYFKRSEKEITKWNKLIAEDKEWRQLVEQAVFLLNDIIIWEKNLPFEKKMEAEQKLMSNLNKS